MSMDAFATKIICKVTASLADDADALAADMEAKGVRMNGPDALRFFANALRRVVELRSEFNSGDDRVRD